eukprot:m.53126 g.53126  ORF g.53126 m.53126 type:complete len:359 (-) comp18359_c0_seq1:31-1107(-)
MYKNSEEKLTKSAKILIRSWHSLDWGEGMAEVVMVAVVTVATGAEGVLVVLVLVVVGEEDEEEVVVVEAAVVAVELPAGLALRHNPLPYPTTPPEEVEEDRTTPKQMPKNQLLVRMLTPNPKHNKNKNLNKNNPNQSEHSNNHMVTHNNKTNPKKTGQPLRARKKDNAINALVVLLVLVEIQTLLPVAKPPTHPTLTITLSKITQQMDQLQRTTTPTTPTTIIITITRTQQAAALPTTNVVRGNEKNKTEDPSQEVTRPRTMLPSHLRLPTILLLLLLLLLLQRRLQPQLQQPQRPQTRRMQSLLPQMQPQNPSVVRDRGNPGEGMDQTPKMATKLKLNPPIPNPVPRHPSLRDFLVV